MAIVTGTPKVDKFTVTANNVLVVTGKKRSTEIISNKGKNKIYGAAAKDTFTVKGGKHNYIYGDKGNDTITVTGKIGTGNKIYGDDAKGKVSGNDTFNINGGSKNHFYGGKGADTFNINGGTGNYLYGGAGKDTYIFGKKKATATIKDYVAGQDTLKVNSGTLTSTTLKDKNVIFKAGNASVTVTGAAAKAISIKDSRGTYTMSKTAITLGKDFTGTMDATKYLSTVKNIDGCNVAKAVNITGNGQANVIYMGYAGGTCNGGAGDDTIEIYGSGEYTVHGNDGKDTVLIDGSGTYTVYGDAGDDNININGSGNGTGNTVYGNDGNDTILIDGSGTYTVYGDAGDDKITINGYGTGNTIYGNDGNDTITITNGANGIIDGGVGNDTVNISGGGNIVISGGAGTDTFNYSYGTAIIKDYEAGETLSFANAVTGITVDGQDITLTAGTSGSVTVENSAESLTQVTEAGKKKSFLFGLSGNIDGTDGNEIIMVTGSNAVTVDAKAGDDTINIDCNANSVIYGGTGTDAFNYTSGTATIKDYEAGETLYFVWGITGVTFNGQDVTLAAGTDGSMTVENGVGKITKISDSWYTRNFIYTFENGSINGTDDDDIIVVPDNDAVTVYAKAGDDIIYGGYLQDGGTGMDILNCGSATQYMYGGEDTDKDEFIFSSDSYKGTIEIYGFDMSSDFLGFKDEGENTVSAVGDPWQDGSDVFLTLSNGSTLKFNNYDGWVIFYIDTHANCFRPLEVSET